MLTRRMCWQGWMASLTLVLGSALPWQAHAADAPPKLAGPPAGFTAPAEPKPDENNAQRGISQPGNNAPMWRAVKEQGGVTSLPGSEMGVLIQPKAAYPGAAYTTAGEAWRQVRNRVLIPYGGSLILIAVLAVALMYWRKGSLGGHVPDTGRTIERFTPFERAAHWTNAIAFVVLAVSGIVLAFGKFFLLPILGSTLFGWLSYALKNAHNFVGPLFAVSLVVVIATFIRDNLPQAGDLRWLAKGGGMFGGEEIPSNRFNAGEKVLFWLGVLSLGLIVVASGLVLDKLVPNLLYTRGQMQVAHMVHAAAALFMMALFVGHIYMGTLGVKGAYKAMRTGQVDEGWAREHHGLWAEDVRQGRIPAQRSAQGAAQGPGAGQALPGQA